VIETDYRIDHVFVCTNRGAPEAQALIDLGLTEGPPNTHPGQGTANRRFFFRSAYLELLWVSDEDEARAAPAQTTLLWERWSGRHDRTVCPFGFVIGPADRRDLLAPFSAREYRPQYLASPLAMQIASAGLHEPMWVYAPFAQATQRDITTSIGIATPAAGRSPVTQAMAGLNLVALSFGSEYLLEVEFDGGASGRQADVRPDLPLVLRW
jgi:hypothetical protein